MKFETLRNHNSNFIPALEANTIDIEGESMNISLITDKIIEDNNLPEVTNPIMFKDGYVPTDDGLFSNYFGGDEVESATELYTCECKHLKGKFYKGIVCPECGTEVKYHNQSD